MRHRYIVPPPRRDDKNHSWNSDVHRRQFKPGDPVVISSASDVRWRKGKIIRFLDGELRVREPGKQGETGIGAGQCDKVFRLEGNGRPRLVNCDLGKDMLAFSLAWLVWLNYKRPSVVVWNGVGETRDTILFHWPRQTDPARKRPDLDVVVTHAELLRCRKPEDMLALIQTEIAIQNVMEVV